MCRLRGWHCDHGAEGDQPPLGSIPANTRQNGLPQSTRCCLLLERPRAPAVPTPAGAFYFCHYHLRTFVRDQSSKLIRFQRRRAPTMERPHKSFSQRLYRQRDCESAFAHKLAGRNALLGAQSRCQHCVKAAKAQAVRIIARVVADLHSARNANDVESRLLVGPFFNHTYHLLLCFSRTYRVSVTHK